MQAQQRFENKVAIITGAGNGIGRSIALGFAMERAFLSLLDVDGGPLGEVAKECAQLGSSDVQTHIVDVSNPIAFQDVVFQTTDHFHKVDILVNNAGLMFPSNLFEETSNNAWEKTFQVNIMGVVNGCKAVIPVMKSQHSGRIINLASMYGIMPQVKRAPYCASKAAVITITEVLAGELGPFGITVNAVAPGTVKTRMADEALGPGANQKLKEIPLNRFAETEEIAHAILFLASDDASYINGVTLIIDGGRLAVQNADRMGLPITVNTYTEG